MVRAGETRCGANGFENLVDVETSNCPWEGGMPGNKNGTATDDKITDNDKNEEWQKECVRKAGLFLCRVKKEIWF